MKVTTKKAVDCSLRAATLAAETDGTSGSAQAKVVLEKRTRSRLPSTLEGSAALSYADIGFFFVSIFVPSHDVPHWSSPACTQSGQTRQSDSSVAARDFFVANRLVVRDHTAPTWTPCLDPSWMGLAWANSFCCRLGGRNRAWNRAWNRGRHNCPCRESNYSHDSRVKSGSTAASTLNARDIHCDSVLVSSFVDDREGPHWSRLILEAQVSPHAPSLPHLNL